MGVFGHDFGNNIALCEDPAETYRLLAPLTFYVSFKDMAVAPYDEGFLLSEMALGEGMLDLAGMVKGLQQRDPDMIFGARDDHPGAAQDSGVHEESTGRPSTTGTVRYPGATWRGSSRSSEPRSSNSRSRPRPV